MSANSVVPRTHRRRASIKPLPRSYPGPLPPHAYLLRPFLSRSPSDTGAHQHPLLASPSSLLCFYPPCICLARAPSPLFRNSSYTLTTEPPTPQHTKSNHVLLRRALRPVRLDQGTPVLQGPPRVRALRTTTSATTRREEKRENGDRDTYGEVPRRESRACTCTCTCACPFVVCSMLRATRCVFVGQRVEGLEGEYIVRAVLACR